VGPEFARDSDALCCNQPMKKILIIASAVLLAVIVAGIVAVGLFLDGAIKSGVESVGPKLTQGTVKLDGVSLSVLSGSGKIKGLILGNPEGYKSASAIEVGSTALSVSPGSLLSDKIVVRSIRVEAPHITYEIGPGGSNLKQLQANVEAARAGAGSTADESAPGKKLQVDEVIVTGGIVTLAAAALGGKGVTAPLPEIRLTGLGKGADGITAADLSRVVLSAITEGSIKVAAGAVTDLGKDATGAAKGAADKAVDSGRGVGDLFKKK
jgi:uncharacterized protein involved in outer membrane biogenesis